MPPRPSSSSTSYPGTSRRGGGRSGGGMAGAVVWSPEGTESGVMGASVRSEAPGRRRATAPFSPWHAPNATACSPTRARDGRWPGLPAQLLPDLDEDLAEHVDSGAVPAVAPVVVVGRVLDDRRIARPEQHRPDVGVLGE